MTRLWNASSSSWALVVLHYTRLYGAQILLVTILSAVTVYRREMSCNHVYTEEEDAEESSHRENDLTRSPTETSSCGQQLSCSPTFWDDLFWDDLDRAGNYCSGEPLLAILMKIIFGSFTLESKNDRIVRSSPSVNPGKRRRQAPQSSTRHHSDFGIAQGRGRDVVAQELPPDLQVLVLSYLEPRDVVTFACASRTCRRIVDKGETSMVLWKRLWYRDYAWIVLSWEVGRQALLRSRRTLDNVVFDKSFYFLFGRSYLDYVLAGKNTTDQCLVGLHGNIYDITSFLDSHPGSPDTLLVNSGRDTTDFFEDMGHSVGARRLTQSLCLVVDKSCWDEGCGLHPTRNLKGGGDLPPVIEGVATPLERTPDPRSPGTLHRIRAKYHRERQGYLDRTRLAGAPNVLGGVNIYYDPFCGEWRGWFTSQEFETVFLNDTHA